MQTLLDVECEGRIKRNSKVFGLSQTGRMGLPSTEMGKRSRFNQFSVMISLIFLLDVLEAEISNQLLDIDGFKI